MVIKNKLLEYIDNIADYCRHINVPLPRHKGGFDCRTFDENMATVKRNVPPFKHEFYAIGLLFEGTSREWHGIKDMKANIVFNSPYQLISWDIENNWSGYYLIFTQDFLMQCHFGNTLLQNFPFLKLDQVKPISVPENQLLFLKGIFENIISEYNSNSHDKFKFIESYLNLILLGIKRFSDNSQEGFVTTENNRTTDINILSRYQTLIESNINNQTVKPDYFSTSYYAQQLSIHPNYLNAIVKRITGSTAKQVIQDKIIHTAKSLLAQSDLSVKEIAWRLGYEESSHFSSFFKKATQLTPVQYKELNHL